MASVLAPGADRNDTIDLLNGFEDLADQAVNRGGRGLDTVHFGKDLTPKHQSFLEHVRHVLIQAQQPSPESKKAAIAAWPSVASTVEASIEHAKQLRIPNSTLAAISDNLAALGDKYIHAPHRGPAEAESAEDYIDLVDGIQHLMGVVEQDWFDLRDGVLPLNLKEINDKQRSALRALAFGGRLSKRHRQLLENLRAALILARTEGSSKEALAHWQAIQGDLKHVFQRAPAFVDGDLGAIRQQVVDVGQQLIHGGVYAEAHNAAVEQNKLQSPELVVDEADVKQALEGFKELDKFAEKAAQLTGENAIDVMLSQGKFEPGMGHAILELAKNPGEILEKLEKFKKQGIIGKAVTVADMADKILAFRQAVYEVGLEIVKRYAEGQVKVAAETGLTEVVEHWEKVGKWAEGKLEMVKAVARVAVVIALVVSAIKVIDYIRQGKWGKALEEIGETALGLAAGAAVGAGGSAMIGGIGVVIAAEIEGIHGAAAMIRYCRIANVRSAALGFIDVCDSAAGFEAQDMVANVKLLADPSMASERAAIEQKLWSDIGYWLRHLEQLTNQLADESPSRLGGQPKLQEALGADALRVLRDERSFTPDWQAMAEQIKVIFAGVNAMAKYVMDNYPRHEKTEEPAESEDED